MKNKPFKRRMLVFLTLLIGLIVIGQILQARCSEGQMIHAINAAIYIDYLYPAPRAKIPFACHTLAFVKSPLAPRNISLNEALFKENGFRVLLGGHGREREGVIVVRISDRGALWHVFPERVLSGKTPLFVESTSLYVDGQELQIGHIGYKELEREFIFTTILNPFLWPGKHVGKIVIQLPRGGTAEYEWEFEITWW